MTCETCGHPMAVGRWPWCPHGEPRLALIDDQLEGGPRFFEHLDHQPVFIASKSQWRREMEQRNLVNVVKHDSAYYARQRKQHDEQLRDGRGL